VGSAGVGLSDERADMPVMALLAPVGRAIFGVAVYAADDAPCFRGGGVWKFSRAITNFLKLSRFVALRPCSFV
jgi:hypothetical protein